MDQEKLAPFDASLPAPSSVSQSGSQEMWAQVPDLSECSELHTSMASGETSASTPSPSIARSSVKRKASAELPTIIPAKRVEGIDGSPGISVDTVNREKASVDVLNPINIGYSHHHDHILKDLPWPVQWEIARLVSTGVPYSSMKYSSLCQLQRCKTIEEGVKRVEELFDPPPRLPDSGRGREQWDKVFEQETASKAPWEELEHEARVINELRVHLRTCTDGSTCGTTHSTYLVDDHGWYGGRVSFTGRLTFDGYLKITLEKPYLFSSTRFSRRFGSDAFVRVRIDHKALHDHGQEVRDYVRRPLVIRGRVYRSYFAKEDTVFFFHTHEVVEPTPNAKTAIHVREPTDPNADALGMSLEDFLEWHNPLRLNDQQSISKWSARFALGLSNSIPGIFIEPRNVNRICDIVSPSYTGAYKSVPAELCMTDGCGLANANVFQLLQEKFKWDTYPTTVQMRFNGAKGLLVLHPEHSTITADRVPRIWIRDSQQKIVYPYDEKRQADPALFSVDILRSSHMATPARLAIETIINLAENGVPFQVFAAMMKVSLQERVDRLSIWDKPEAGFTPMSLWADLAREGGVFAARLARMHAGAARAKGYVYEDRAEGDDDVDSRKAQSSAWWDDPVSGCPSSLEETAMHLLDSGFLPDTCPVLREKLKVIAIKTLSPARNSYRMPVVMSCTAFVIPDPTGSLAPGEVHIKSSTRNLVGPDGKATELIEGEVLLTRHPCKLPTDVQKAVAVYKRELRDYVDVIVVSVRGHIVNGEVLGRHLTSMTGGGDYDGDLMEAFWAPEIVQSFKPADKAFASDPEGLHSCLKQSQTTVSSFARKVAPGSMPYKERIWNLQTHLLASLVDAGLVGTYSNLWEESIYHNGYSHPDTILYAWIFCKILDGGKTGTTIQPSRLKQDRAQKSPKGVHWKMEPNKKYTSTSPMKYDTSNRAALKRRPGLKTFIMDILRDVVTAECDKLQALIEVRFAPLARADCYDPDLARPWEEFVKESGDVNRTACEAVKKHVSAVWQRCQDDKMRSGKDFTSLPITVRQDLLREQSLLFAAGPDVEFKIRRKGHDIEALVASYAYIHDHLSSRSGWSRFPFNVAFRTLCDIKAKATSYGVVKTVSMQFYAAFAIKRSFLNP